MIGEPVSSLLYENPSDISMSALVLLALGFLMVVLSSMAISRACLDVLTSTFLHAAPSLRKKPPRS